MQIGAHEAADAQDSCKIAKMETPDKLDRQILSHLQADGRATYDDIAASVGLSPSANQAMGITQNGIV